MLRKIRICYLINSFAVGGAETVVLNLCRKLSPDQFEVTVLSVLESDLDQISPMRQRFIDANIKTEVMSLGNIKNPFSFFKLLFFFQRNKFNIIHGHNRPSDSWGVVVGRYAAIKNRLWTRHLVYRDMSAQQLNRYHSLSDEIRIVLAVSDAVRQNCIEYEGIPANKVSTVVNGIDTDMFAPLGPDEVSDIRAELGCPSDAEMLVFVGRLAEQKAPEGFVKLIGELRARGRNVHGYMCGAGPLADTLNKMVQPDSGVHLLGLRNDIPAILAAADLFVSTSRNEGLPLNVMEAMSAGTPIVGPEIDQISCLFDGHPVLMDALYSKPPESGPLSDELISEWAVSVGRVLDDSETLSSKGLTGRVIIQTDYSLEKMVKVHSGLYLGFMERS